MTTCTPLAGERVEVDGQRGDQRLAFAGLHLGDLALVQHHAADQLHVEMPLAERALGGLAHGGEGRHEQVVERSPSASCLRKAVGAGPQLGVGQPLQLRLQRVDGLDLGPVGLELAVVGASRRPWRLIAPIDSICQNPVELLRVERSAGKPHRAGEPPSEAHSRSGETRQNPRGVAPAAAGPAGAILR